MHNIFMHIGLQNFKLHELCRICTCAHAGTYLCNCFKCRCISLIKKVANNIYDNLANVEKVNNGMCYGVYLTVNGNLYVMHVIKRTSVSSSVSLSFCSEEVSNNPLFVPKLCAERL